jgi:hypothetical protein
MDLSQRRAAARLLLSAVLCAVLLSLAAGAAGRVYHGVLFAVLVAGAAIGSVAVSLLLQRGPQWTVAPVSVLAMLGYVGFAIWWSARAAGVPGSFATVLADALRNGGPRLLTALIPIEAQPDTVLLPVILVWTAGLVTAELALRAGRMSLALIPPTVIYLAALVLAGPHGAVDAWRALVYVALCGTALASTQWDGAKPEATTVAGRTGSQPPPVSQSLSRLLRLRAAAGLVAFLAAVAAVVPVVALAVPHRPADPRVAVSPPRLDTLDANPLARISGWMQTPTRPLFDLDLAVPPAAPARTTEARVTLAVLGDFDGVNWTVGGSYRDAGRQLPATGTVTPAGTTLVREQISVRELAGRLVPAVNAPREVDGVRVAFDEGSGTLLLNEGLHAGTKYSVVSELPRYDANLLPTADVPAGADVARYLRAGDNVPDDVRKLVDSIQEGNGGAYQRASALEQFLADHYTFVGDAPGGHAYPNLRFFLLGARQQGGQRGTSEQFAAAYAVMGRLMGLPTRVVVGFTAKAGHSTVHAADALAWPEVLFSGIGWVRFNPLPAKAGTVVRPLEQDYRPKPDPPSHSPSTPPTTAEPRLPSRSPSATAAIPAPGNGSSGAGRLLVLAGAGTLLGVLGLAPVAVVVARRRRSTRRRSRGSPSDRVRGAWLDVLDAFALAGHRRAAHHTVTEAARTVAGPGRELPRIDALVELVNMVGFAPESADEVDAATAVDQADLYVRALRGASPRWRRWCWWLHPGPLRWHHGLPFTERPGRPVEPARGALRPAVPRSHARR